MWVEVIYRHMHATPGDISMLDANAVMRALASLSNFLGIAQW